MEDFFAGFQRPWWVVGGWAIEAFTGAPREHEDVDVSILACDVPALRAHVGDTWHLWNIADGALRPLIDHWPDVTSREPDLGASRRHLPWIFDMPLTPDRDGLWTNKRLPDHVAPLEEVTWVADDGIRYLNPEIVLMYKARLRSAQGRPRPRPLPAPARLRRPRVAAGQRRPAVSRARLAGSPLLTEPDGHPSRPTGEPLVPGGPR